MRKISIFALITSLFVSSFVIANEVNVFNARHYKADGELYSKFTNMTGIKVNLINGKSGALEKRIISEGEDSSADLIYNSGCWKMWCYGCKRYASRWFII